MIGGARILASIKTGNGIVHVIDKVLLPPTD
ncbi:fasciclin domain-containing protein [Winogradskyella marina]|nr:fasciclin domain-containing protein [Winogradskyella marina]